MKRTILSAILFLMLTTACGCGSNNWDGRMPPNPTPPPPPPRRTKPPPTDDPGKGPGRVFAWGDCEEVYTVPADAFEVMPDQHQLEKPVDVDATVKRILQNLDSIQKSYDQIEHDLDEIRRLIEERLPQPEKQE